MLIDHKPLLDAFIQWEDKNILNAFLFLREEAVKSLIILIIPWHSAIMSSSPLLELSVSSFFNFYYMKLLSQTPQRVGPGLSFPSFFHVLGT